MIPETFQLTASRRGWRVDKLSLIVVTGISTHSLTKRLTYHLILRHEQITYFNSQPHEEADRITCDPEIIFFHFNSQPHEEADYFRRRTCINFNLFQLTASRRGWRNCARSVAPVVYFNSQPHEEADDALDSFMARMMDISTHSLTKRLTRLRSNYNQTTDISTHSLTKRLTNQTTDKRPANHISTHSLTKRLTTGPAT